jgi:hypothetical protein
MFSGTARIYISAVVCLGGAIIALAAWYVRIADEALFTSLCALACVCSCPTSLLASSAPRWRCPLVTEMNETGRKQPGS